MIAPTVKLSRKLTLGGGSLVTAVVALAVFVAMNPFMTVRPANPLPKELQEIAEPECLAATSISR